MQQLETVDCTDRGAGSSEVRKASPNVSVTIVHDILVVIDHHRDRDAITRFLRERFE